VKACPDCGRLYPDEAGFCPIDGRQLINVSQAPVASDANDARIGQVICGAYQVRRVVADGGMGRVYEALDLAQRRNVALKVLHPDVATDSVALERFRREFEVSKLLAHDHIVDVIDFQATGDGSYALVMDFLYGEELRSALKRETVLAPARIVRMLSQLAIGLDGAHARHLVHRDLKPENVFLCQTRDGDIVKVLDFGSVKDKTDTAKKLTVMGTTIGSPYYMAPEQAQGLDTLDHRADVWALAAIAYECMTGRVPFSGNNGPSILLEILTKTPAPPTQAATNPRYSIPPTMDGVMNKAFQKNAALRWSSVGELADQVGQAYGLSGGHKDWVARTQDELESAIAARLPEILNAPAAPGTSDLDGGFFGDGQGLGSLAPEQALADSSVAQFSPTIPGTDSKWLIFSVVGGVLVVVAIAVILLFVL